MLQGKPDPAGQESFAGVKTDGAGPGQLHAAANRVAIGPPASAGTFDAAGIRRTAATGSQLHARGARQPHPASDGGGSRSLPAIDSSQRSTPGSGPFFRAGIAPHAPPA